MVCIAAPPLPPSIVKQEMSNSFWCARPREITAEGQVEVYAFTKSGRPHLCVLNFRSEVFSSETEDGEHVDLALFQLLPAEFYRVGAAGNGVTQCAFAFTQVVIASEAVFDIFERAQSEAYVTCGGSFLLGGAKVLRSLEFTTEKNRLGDGGGQSPKDGIDRADAIQLRCSESASGAEDKARQSGGASFVHAMECGSETALAGDEVGPAFEELRRQTCGHGSRL